MTPFKMEYLQIIPEFLGERAILTEFIAAGDQLIRRFYDKDNPENFDNILLLKAIKNKIKGEAANRLAAYETNTWNEIKAALLGIYSDKRDLQTLSIEMCSLRQGRLTPSEFYERIRENLNLQISWIKINQAQLSPGLMWHSRALALRIFLKNLNHPLGDYISTRNPGSLEDAYELMVNDFTISNRVETNPPRSPPFRPFNPSPHQGTNQIKRHESTGNGSPSPQNQQRFFRSYQTGPRVEAYKRPAPGYHARREEIEPMSISSNTTRTGIPNKQIKKEHFNYHINAYDEAIGYRENDPDFEESMENSLGELHLSDSEDQAHFLELNASENGKTPH